MTSLLVGIGECRFADKAEYRLLCYGLGSCIGVAAWDPVTRSGGLLHYMLPDSGLSAPKASSNPGLFADTGLKMLLTGCEAMGSSRRRLVLHAVGAARMFDNSAHFDVGNRNIASLRSLLRKEHMRLNGELLGGTRSRSMSLELGTGVVTVREAADPWRELPGVQLSGASRS